MYHVSLLFLFLVDFVDLPIILYQFAEILYDWSVLWLIPIWASFATLDLPLTMTTIDMQEFTAQQLLCSMGFLHLLCYNDKRLLLKVMCRYSLWLQEGQSCSVHVLSKFGSQCSCSKRAAQRAKLAEDMQLHCMSPIPVANLCTRPDYLCKDPTLTRMKKDHTLISCCHNE